MSVRFYSFGRLVGGSGSGGGAVAPAEALYGPEESFRGSTGAGIVTINFANATKTVTVRNTDDTDNMQVSYDGATWHDLGPYAAVDVNALVSSIRLRGVGGVNCDYEVIGVLTS